MFENLTEREKEILVLITHGKKTPQIASDLQISTGTIDNYVRVMLLKTGTANRAQLVYEALKKGVIQ